VEVALNGVDYVMNESAVFTFIGPNAGKMLWVYVLITLFTALLLIGLAVLVSSYWNRMAVQSRESRHVDSSDQPHVVNKQPRYLDPILRGDQPGLANPDDLRRIRVDEDNNRRNIAGSIV
jgi:hypothetical protein